MKQLEGDRESDAERKLLGDYVPTILGVWLSVLLQIVSSVASDTLGQKLTLALIAGSSIVFGIAVALALLTRRRLSRKLKEEPSVTFSASEADDAKVDDFITVTLVARHPVGPKGMRWVRLVLTQCGTITDWANQVYLSVTPGGKVNLWGLGAKDSKAGHIGDATFLETQSARIDLAGSRVQSRRTYFQVALRLRVKLAGELNALMTARLDSRPKNDPDAILAGKLRVSEPRHVPARPTDASVTVGDTAGAGDSPREGWWPLSMRRIALLALLANLLLLTLGVVDFCSSAPASSAAQPEPSPYEASTLEPEPPSTASSDTPGASTDSTVSSDTSSAAPLVDDLPYLYRPEPIHDDGTLIDPVTGAIVGALVTRQV